MQLFETTIKIEKVGICVLKAVVKLLTAANLLTGKNMLILVFLKIDQISGAECP